MAAPLPYFTFTASGLTVNFTDKSSGTVNTYLWDFGFKANGTEVTSNVQNPIGIVFPNSGIFNVTLSVTNADGTNNFTFAVSVSQIPTIGISISEMVLGEMPMGISVTDNYFNALVKKWQLYFQKSQNISDADVFDESKWPTLVNVLIAKLVVWDLMTVVQRNIINYRTTSTGSSILLTDFSLTLDFPINVISILIDASLIPGPTTPINSGADMVTWLNSLNMGLWSFTDDLKIQSIGNSHNVTVLTYNNVGDTQQTQVLFTQNNQRISQSNSLNYTSGAIISSKGPVKRIETGPSNAEWFDPSAFWANLLKSGILQSSKDEICDLAAKVGVRLLICPKINKTRLFIVGSKYCRW